MNEPLTQEINDPPQVAPVLKQPSLRELISQIVYAFDHFLSGGELAELRRLKPHDQASPTFFKISALYLDPAGILPNGITERNQAEQKWACILARMASLHGLHNPNSSIGSALAEAGFSELRFVRLLRAKNEALFDVIHGAANYLSSKGISVNFGDFASLVLSDGFDHSENVRREIARKYYSAINQNTQEGAKKI
ncbi:MAG: type I-E CRISPR-associated protein Cse2/CasB [Candidatus Riflebacteria bacterium]|nr:type I-E CRISPR-associated protein Cse2/CasB [Candidatus Riflebacteria bacterium]